MATPEPIKGPWDESLPPDPREIREVCVDQLFIDSNVQREINFDRVLVIAQEFDWNRFEMPSVVEMPDGRLRVIEGQHRCLALQERDPYAMVRVLVLDVTAPSEEAGTALAITTGRQRHTPLAQWKLRVQRGDQHEVLAERVLHTKGLRLGQKATVTSIACVGQISKAIHADRQTPEAGAALLNRSLDVILGAYPTGQGDSDTTRWNADIVHAVLELVRRNPTLTVSRLITALRGRIAQQWISFAIQADRSAWVIIAEKVADQYNKGLRSDRKRISL